jgi:hypothetical protein
MALNAPVVPAINTRASSLSRALLALLDQRFMPLGAVIASLALCAPALSAGLIADDYIHQLILRGARTLPAYQQHWSALFAFATDQNRAALMDEGILPWWADPQLRFAFFRPVSALTHLLDMRLWPESPWLMHAHSFAWSALALMAAYALYLRVFAIAAPRSAPAPNARALARLALLFYALEPTRAVAVGWIANRNTLVSLSLSLAAVCLHLDDMVSPRLMRRIASPVLLALAVLAGEGGVSGLAFLVAAAMVLDARTQGRAWLALLPHFAAAGGVVALGSALGYGMEGSDGYLDPRRDLSTYLVAFPARAIALLSAGIGGPAADAIGIYDLLWPGLSTMMKLLSLALLGLLGYALAALFFESQSARFFGLSLCLALPPACVAFSADRLLTWISVAALGVLAECAMVALRGHSAQPRALQLAAAAVLGARVLFAPLLLFAQAQNLPHLGDLLRRADETIPKDAAVTEQLVVFVNAPEEPLISFVLPQRAAADVPRPKALRRWAAGFSHVAITRVAPERVEVFQDGGFLQQHTERMLRSPRTRPFKVGERYDVPGMRAEILEVTGDKRPLSVAFVLDPQQQYAFYALTAAGYQHFELPALGACVVLETPSFLEFVLGPDNALARWLKPSATPELCQVAASIQR